ncbi:MAG: DUF433 domain-containing protein [Pseudonocardiaceae bacterium]|nr:DUF433 domain-containing protein [Pseudonocardiaceae bacterium]
MQRRRLRGDGELHRPEHTLSEVELIAACSGPRSIVRIRPDVRFGRPSVKGISTEVLWEQVDAGAGIAEVADDFGLTQQDVRWAVSYEAARVA